MLNNSPKKRRVDKKKKQKTKRRAKTNDNVVNGTPRERNQLKTFPSSI